MAGQKGVTSKGNCASDIGMYGVVKVEPS